MFLCRWTLTEDESYTTFEAWRTNLMTILAYEEAFTPFLKPDATWGRKTKTSPLRGFHVSDAAQQVTTLETMLGLIANYAPVVSCGMIVKNCTSLNAVWKALHLNYGIQSSDDTHHLPNSKTLHQSDEPSYQDYSMCKSARKSNHDIQQLPAKNKAFLKSSESKIQSFASDSHILRPDDESSLTNMNTLDISMLSQDCEQSVPDSPEMINLKCVVPNFLPQESRPKQFLSSDQKSNMLFTVFFSQNVPSSEHSFLRPLFKTSITTMYRAHLCPAPGRRLALRRPVWMKTTSQTYKASNHPHQSRKFYMTKQTQRNRVN